MANARPFGNEMIVTAAFVGTVSGISAVGSHNGQHWPDFFAMIMVALAFSGLTAAALSLLRTPSHRIFNGLLIVTSLLNASYVGANITSTAAVASLENWLLLAIWVVWCHVAGLFSLSYFAVVDLGPRRTSMRLQWSLKEQIVTLFAFCTTLALSIGVAAKWRWWVAFHFVMEPFVITAGVLAILSHPGSSVLRMAKAFLYAWLVVIGLRHFEIGWHYSWLESAFGGEYRYRHVDYVVSTDVNSHVASALCFALASTIVASVGRPPVLACNCVSLLDDACGTDPRQSSEGRVRGSRPRDD